MQDSWLEAELGGKKDEDFMHSSNVNKSALPSDPVGSRPPPPNPMMKQSTLVGGGSFPAVKEIDSDEGEDDLQIDKKPAKAPATTVGTNQVGGTTISTAKPTTTNARPSDHQSSFPKPNDPTVIMKKKIFKYNLAAIILGILSSAVILFCFSNAYKGFDQAYFPFESIKTSWSKEFIVDIEQKPQGLAACSANYVPALSYKWPGSVDGCDCSKSTGTDKGIYKIPCTGAQNGTGCATSKAVEPKNLNKWRDSKATTEFLCVKRMPNLSMNTTIFFADIKNRTCMKGYKVCPPPSDEPLKDEFGRRVCIPESEPDCPISQLKIAPCGKEPDNTGCYSKLKKVSIDGSMCIHMSNHCGNFALTDLAIGEEGVCRHENDVQIGNNHTDYPLLRSQRSRCDNSENSFKLDAMAQKEFFDRNGITVSDIGRYGDNIENNFFSLYMMAPHRWVWAHRDREDLKMVVENQKYIQRLENYHSRAIGFFTIGLIVFIVGSPIMFYLEHKKPSLYKDNRFLLYGKYLVQWFFKLSAIPVIAVILKFNSDIWVKFKQFGESQFSNPTENAKIGSMAKSIETGIYGFDRIALWVAVSTIIVDIYLLVCICKMEQKKLQQEDMDLDTSLVGDGIELEKK